jgi:hypothetical protein
VVPQQTHRWATIAPSSVFGRRSEQREQLLGLAYGRATEWVKRLMGRLRAHNLIAAADLGHRQPDIGGLH